MAAEDYTGASPVQAGGPNYLGFYQDALDANGTGYDVYDVDARGRTAPDALGVLSHYDAVIWYTGEDIVTREPGWGGGNASRLALDNTLEVRDFLNEGGRVLYTGKYAGTQYTRNLGTSCTTRRRRMRSAAPTRRCRSGAGPSAGRATSPTTSCSTGSVRTSPSTMPARRRTEASSTSSASTTPFTGSGLGVQRRRQRREPGPQQLVHHDERHPRPGRVPAVRELGRGQVGS